MNLLHKVTLLLGSYEKKTLRQQREIFCLENKRENIQQTLEALNSQLQGMRSLLKNMQPQGEKLNQADFFSLQRKQSVIRRRIANTILEISQKKLSMTNCKQDMLVAQELLKQLLHQTDKYKGLRVRERKKIYELRAQREELETEEIIAWRKL